MQGKKIGLITTAMCLILGATRAAQAASTSIDLQFSSVVNPVSSDYLALFSSGVFKGYAPLADIPAGDSSQSLIISPTGSSQTVPTNLNDNFPIDAFGVVGVYTPATGPQGVSVVVNTAEATTLQGETFGQAFPPLGSEASTVLLLQNPPLGTINTILAAGLSGIPGAVNVVDTGNLVDFTNGTLNGTAVATIGPTAGGTAIPLPAAVWPGATLLVILAGASAIRARKNARIA